MPDNPEQAIVFDRIMRQLETLEARMTEAEQVNREMHRQINSSSSREPGLALRVDRMERAISMVKWMGTGGLTGMVGTLYLLWQILEK